MRNKIINTQGYILIYKPDHPYCTKKGYVREHRLVMEEFLGRYLNNHEDIHHINENKQDNRLKNLQLLTHGDHMSLTNKKDMSNRLCAECGSSKTSFEKNKYYHWRLNPITKIGLVCGTCYRRLNWRNNK